MNPEPPNQPPTRKPSLPSLFRWFAWGGLILIGAGLAIPLVSAIVSAGKESAASRTLPIPLVIIAIWFALFFGIKALTNPILGRSDERRAWKERFPRHTDQEFERFLRVTTDSLLTSEKHRDRLRPDDRVAALTQESMGGDGMDIIEFVMAVEGEYRLELPESFLERAQTLGDFFAYVTQHGAAKPPPSASEQPTPTEDA
jgi:acyl carrier protein